MINIQKTILIFLAAVFVSQIVFYYPILPDTVATHFNAQGKADGFMYKHNFAVFEGVLLIFILSLPYWNLALMNIMPSSLINMPNRDFWFAEERREATLKTLKTYFEWLSVALLTMFIGINQLAIKANLGEDKILSGKFWIVLGAFLLFIVVWTAKFYKRFRRIY